MVIEGKEYVDDGKGITREEFYRRLPAFRAQPTTAAPSIGDFSARYESLLTRGCDHVLSIHAAGALTSILNVACQAANDFPARVICLDSTSLSLGVGFQVLAAAEAAEMGLEAALAAIADVGPHAVAAHRHLTRIGTTARAVVDHGVGDQQVVGAASIRPGPAGAPRHHRGRRGRHPPCPSHPKPSARRVSTALA